MIYFAILDCYSDYGLDYTYPNINSITTTPHTNIPFYETNGICESATAGNIK